MDEEKLRNIQIKIYEIKDYIYILKTALNNDEQETTDFSPYTKFVEDIEIKLNFLLKQFL